MFTVSKSQAIGRMWLGLHATVPLAVLVGLFFPLTWTVFYLRDEHPYRRVHRHAA